MTLLTVNHDGYQEQTAVIDYDIVFNWLMQNLNS